MSSLLMRRVGSSPFHPRLPHQSQPKSTILQSRLTFPQQRGFCNYRQRRCAAEPLSLRATRRRPQIPLLRMMVATSALNCSSGNGCYQRIHHHQPRTYRSFHSTTPAQGWPLIAAVFKTSTALGITQTVGRIMMTFLPIALGKQFMAKKALKRADRYPHLAEEAPKVLRKARIVTLAVFAIPLSLLAITIMFSLERTPLSGRLRIILLSPEEEETISQQLAGIGWYNAVAEILTQTAPNGRPPRVIPLSDWRTQWVLDTMRKLEAAIPLLQSENLVHASHFSPEIPIPPPAEYPLIPRPRASQIIHQLPWMESKPDNAPPQHPPHSVLGPPYSLLVVERPEASNAFSYGFGPDGGGGVVVYSGFLDEILASPPAATPAPQQQSQSVWSLFSGSRPPTATHSQPTEQQTSKLAVLLAHELSHLMLSHHLETLSSGTIFLPTLASIISDVLRTVLFPVTMILGPFVNDGIGELGRIGLGEFAKAGDACTSRKMEIEADIVSARLLAYAGFDPRMAVSFWEARQQTHPDDCDPASGSTQPPKQETASRSGTFLSGWGARNHTASHPLGTERVSRLKGELERWQSEKARTLELRTPLPLPRPSLGLSDGPPSSSPPPPP